MNTLQTKLLAKFPDADIFEGIVITATERRFYVLDSAGRLRCQSKRQLTPTEISVNAQPIDSVIVLADDNYYRNYVGDGYINTTTYISKAHKMRKSVASEQAKYLAFHARYSHGKSFVVTTV